MVVPALVVLRQAVGAIRRRDHGQDLGTLERGAPGVRAIAIADLQLPVVSLVLFLCAVVAWRTPTLVDAVEERPWLLAAEVLSLVILGVILV